MASLWHTNPALGPGGQNTLFLTLHDRVGTNRSRGHRILRQRFPDDRCPRGEKTQVHMYMESAWVQEACARIKQMMENLDEG